jgi:hypothetical protein
MRRTMLVAVVTAVVTSTITSVTVSAASNGRDAAPSNRADRAESGARLPVIVDTKIDCGVPRRGEDWPNQDALEESVRCLEDELRNVNRFMKVFFRCARILEVTRYGEDPEGGTFGYVWDNGDGSPVFLKTALDFTIDPTTEPFNYFMLWQDSEFCLS